MQADREKAAEMGEVPQFISVEFTQSGGIATIHRKTLLVDNKIIVEDKGEKIHEGDVEQAELESLIGLADALLATNPRNSYGRGRFISDPMQQYLTIKKPDGNWTKVNVNTDPQDEPPTEWVALVSKLHEVSRPPKP